MYSPFPAFRTPSQCESLPKWQPLILMGVVWHVETGKQTCLGQVVVQGEQRFAHEWWCLQVPKNMRDEVAWVYITRVPLLVDSTGTGLQGAVIVDDDFVHAEDS